MQALNRREFLRLAGLTSASLALLVAGCQASEPQSVPTLEPETTKPAIPAQPKQAEALSSPTAVPPERSETWPTPTGPQPPAPTRPPTTVRPTATDEPVPEKLPDLSIVHGDDAKTNTIAVIDSLGGMSRFVSKGDDVIVKPNICADYHPAEYAATTNPDVVAALVTMCLEAGAKKVRVMDTPFGGTPESAYGQSGIADAVEAAGGKMEVMTPVKFQKTAIPDGRDIKEWVVYDDIVSADVVIDVPIAKHHSLARLTLGGKNLIGVVKSPGDLHRNLHQRIADLVSLVRPTLTVIDAYRILTANGPTGGNLDDVIAAKTIVASPDIVAADSWAATLFGLTGSSIGYVKLAAEMGLGTMDLGSLGIDEQHL